MAKPSVETEPFDTVVDRIRAAYPNLRVEVRRELPHVRALAEIPQQPGLSFGFSVNLQDPDELHLNAGGHFWVESFPADEPEILDQFTKSVIGLISGEYRIVESYVFGRAVNAQLERPRATGGWERVATWSNLGSLIPWARRRTIVQNKAASLLNR